MARIDDDTLITPTLLRRFAAESTMEGGNGQHHAFIERSNGVLLDHNPGSPECLGEQLMFAADVLRKLNRELHHDGAWVMVYTHPAEPAEGSVIFVNGGNREYRRFVLLWLDQDGDVQIPIDWVKGESELADFPDCLIAGIEYWMQLCENAWDLWHTHMRQVLEPRQGETFRRARGERASSTRH
jgi:hypothetical protein